MVDKEKTIMKRELILSKKNADFYGKLMGMTGKQIYDKYGYKRDETFIHTAKFENGFEVDIKLVICDEDEYPYVEAVLFENGHERACSDGTGDSMLGEWNLSYNGTEYEVDVKIA